MLNRILQINNELESSIFLLGARQTGKSTVLRQQLTDATFIDLLDSDVRERLKRRPGLLYDMLIDLPDESVVVIDEIPEVPELLNEVHRLITQKNHRFADRIR